MNLIDMTIENARRIKYIVGREKYGSDAFIGHPVEELHDELIDAANYIEEAEKRGYEMGDLAERVREMTERVRAIYQAERE
jgi:hypothetical protein